jgi:hypothetical protein
MSSRPDFWTRKFPRTVRVVRWVWFVVFTIIALVLIPSSMADLFHPSGDGAKGTAVITRCDASLKFRPCYGNFISDDGTVRLTNQQIGGEDNSQPGRRFTAYGDASNKSIIVPSTSERAGDIALSVGLLLAWLVLFYFVVYRAIRRRRRAAVA